jgi:broad specificity polyphosphatase/5'/3'-nucleotidase SurE
MSEDDSTLALTSTTLSQCDVRQLNVRQSDAGAHIGTHVDCVSIARLVV